MKNIIKQITVRILRHHLLINRVVIPPLPYDAVIINRGNGEWYHGYENPFQHRWAFNKNRATCLICGQVVAAVLK